MANQSQKAIGVCHRMERLNGIRTYIFSAICFLFWCAAGFAQQGVTTLGIQFRPMIPSKYFGITTELESSEGLTAEYSPRFGHNFGMVIRRGFTKAISFETGICLVQRNYRVALDLAGFPGRQEMDFRFIGYEIPVQGLVFVQLGDELWMNASGGLSLDMYPSNVETFGEARRDTVIYDLYQKTWRNGRLQLSLLANYGFEWRTKENGYFYAGLSYHRPFNRIGFSEVEVREKTNVYRLEHMLSGNYLTVDLRYYFAEDPERPSKKRK